MKLPHRAELSVSCGHKSEIERAERGEEGKSGERGREKDDEESSWAGLLRAKDNAHNFTEKEREGKAERERERERVERGERV